MFPLNGQLLAAAFHNPLSFNNSLLCAAAAAAASANMRATSGAGSAAIPGLGDITAAPMESIEPQDLSVSNRGGVGGRDETHRLSSLQSDDADHSPALVTTTATGDNDGQPTWSYEEQFKQVIIRSILYDLCHPSPSPQLL